MSKLLAHVFVVTVLFTSVIAISQPALASCVGGATKIHSSMQKKKPTMSVSKKVALKRPVSKKVALSVSKKVALKREIIRQAAISDIHKKADLVYARLEDATIGIAAGVVATAVIAFAAPALPVAVATGLVEIEPIMAAIAVGQDTSTLTGLGVATIGLISAMEVYRSSEPGVLH